MTFEGPRIVNVAYYVAEACREYSIPPDNLLTWTYAEQELLNEYYEKRPEAQSFGVIAPPPHHRFG
jgi:hypothetical protein